MHGTQRLSESVVCGTDVSRRGDGPGTGAVLIGGDFGERGEESGEVGTAAAGLRWGN